MKTLILILILTAGAFGQAQRYVLHGSVVTERGEQVGGVGLTFKTSASEEKLPYDYYAKDGFWWNRVTTEMDGSFSISLLRGNYQVTLTWQEHKTFMAFINIQESLNPQDVVFTINEANLCCNSKTNPKLLYFPSPLKFPPVARAVGASGEVIVNVVIDDVGNVVEATTTSGHPLLRQISLVSAKKAIFERLNDCTDVIDVRPHSLRQAEISYVYIFLDERIGIPLTRYTNPYRKEVIIVSGN